ncbi:hypothetical protein [Acinetobacter haemolyticus]|nr:hypothetical protein [Acinetobacter haemolyticus]ENW22494.1 hypothetical protein F926_00513 [Acinetobacter haemolyticus NIPH 261]
MRNEFYKHQELNFEIKTISEADSFEYTDLVVAIKFNGELLEFYYAHSETVGDFKTQNNIELEATLYRIAKSEIESKFSEIVSKR